MEGERKEEETEIESCVRERESEGKEPDEKTEKVRESDKDLHEIVRVCKKGERVRKRVRQFGVLAAHLNLAPYVHSLFLNHR